MHKQTKQKHNTTRAGHHYAQTNKTKTQHNMCWTPLYTNKQNKNTTQHVLDNTMHKQTKQKHNTTCTRHHYTQTNTNNVNKTRISPQTTGGKTTRTSFLC